MESFADREYLEQIKAEAKQTFPKATFECRIVRFSHIYLRAVIEGETFIDIYLNKDTARQDFSLIHKDRRLFGYDNLGDWHRHPYEDVKKHEVCEQPSVKTIFEEMKQIIGSIGLDR